MNWKFWAKSSNKTEPIPHVTWCWSESPGGHERHLQRRWSNPLFPMERRTVTAEDVYLAQEKDEEAINPLIEEVVSLQRNWPEELPLNFISWCHERREIIDELLSRYYELGGHSEILELLQHMRRCVISTWEAGLTGNPEGLSALAEAEKEMSKWVLLDNTFVAQSTIGSVYIPQDELLPAILSEPIENIRAFCRFITLNLSEEESLKKLTILRNASLDLIRLATAELLSRNEEIPNWAAKLEAIGANNV